MYRWLRKETSKEKLVILEWEGENDWKVFEKFSEDVGSEEIENRDGDANTVSLKYLIPLWFMIV